MNDTFVFIIIDCLLLIMSILFFLNIIMEKEVLWVLSENEYYTFFQSYYS